MKQPTVKDLLDFIENNKTNKVFIGLTVEQIDNEVYCAIKEGTLLYHTDSEGNINGMILAKKDESTKTLDVLRNLAMNLTILKKFGARCKELLPDYKLTWRKHGIAKTHNTIKLYQKLHV